MCPDRALDPPLDELLRRWLREDFSVDVASLVTMTGGTDEAAQLWRGVDVHGESHAIKLSGGGSPAGLLVAAHLAQHGVAGVPAPVRSRSGELWSERDGRRLSLSSWVHDGHAPPGPMTLELWAAFGTLLAQVHAVPLSDELAAALAREMHTHERATAVVGAIDGWLSPLVEDPAARGDHLVESLVETWWSAREDVMALLGATDQLGEELRAREATTVVCHADPHLGNLLVGEDATIWLLDWDDALLAPRERDLMFAVAGPLGFGDVTDSEQAAFFAGYGPVDLDLPRLTYYRCTRAFEDLDFVAHILDLQRPDPARAWALDIVRPILANMDSWRRAVAPLLGRR